jgi:hypothetical protein
MDALWTYYANAKDTNSSQRQQRQALINKNLMRVNCLCISHDYQTNEEILLLTYKPNMLDPHSSYRSIHYSLRSYQWYDYYQSQSVCPRTTKNPTWSALQSRVGLLLRFSPTRKVPQIFFFPACLGVELRSA